MPAIALLWVNIWYLEYKSKTSLARILLTRFVKKTRTGAVSLLSLFTANGKLIKKNTIFKTDIYKKVIYLPIMKCHVWHFSGIIAIISKKYGEYYSNKETKKYFNECEVFAISVKIEVPTSFISILQAKVFLYARCQSHTKKRHIPGVRAFSRFKLKPHPHFLECKPKT